MIHHGNCLDILPTMERWSVDSVVTDSPYGLTEGFDIEEVLRCWLDEKPYNHAAGGFMGRKWDSFIPGPEYWKEIFRVLKPGSWCLTFAGSRTQDLMGIAMRLAGFDVRDTLAFLYSTGFPKSHNLSMAIDKHLGVDREKVRVEGRQIRNPKAHQGGHGIEGGDRPYMREAVERGYHDMTSNDPVSDDAKKWHGWGTALKPAIEPIIMARKPFPGTYAENVVAHGAGGLNLAACRVGERRTGWGGAPGFGFTHGGLLNQTDEARPVVGNFPPNVLLSHSQDCERVTGELHNCSPDCPVDTINRQSRGIGQLDASAYFPVFSYDEMDWTPFLLTPKPSVEEKEAGLDGLPIRLLKRTNPGGLENDPKFAPVGRRNPHPTCKSVALMRWLCRLVTPPGGTILDPFCGSGTTGVAAILEGFNFIGIEGDFDNQGFVDVARARLAHAQRKMQTQQGRMF